MLTDMVPDHSHAPGCFASALMCRTGTPECDSCIFVSACAPLSAAKREALHAKFGVTKPASRPKAAPKAKPAKAAKPAVISTGARELVERIEKAGLDVGASLRRGTNPFEKPAYLKVVCHLLLKRAAGVDRDLLCAALTHKLEWEPHRALVHAQTAIEALTALGAAELSNGRLCLRTTL